VLSLVSNRMVSSDGRFTRNEIVTGYSPEKKTIHFDSVKPTPCCLMTLTELICEANSSHLIAACYSFIDPVRMKG